jgi:PAS domain S-box-containing protein
MTEPPELERKRARIAALEAEVMRLRAELDERRPSRDGLSKREALLVEAERVAHLGSFTWDLLNGEIGWSDEFYRILGHDPTSLQPSAAAFFGAIHPEDRARIEEMAAQSIAAGKMPPTEYRVVRPSGDVRELHMEGALVYDDAGVKAHVVGTVLDVTDQRRAARLIAGTLAELNEAQRIAGLASWRWDARSRVAEWSKGVFRLLKLPEDTPPSKELFILHIHPDDRARMEQHLENIRASTATREKLEFRLLQSDGNIIDTALYAAPLRDDTGEYVGVRGVMQDITERKQLEEQVRHSQKMEAVGTLAGGVAHDFNNYLMVIAGYTELLRDQLKDDHDARPSVDAIYDAYERCAHLTQQLLTLSRKRKALPVALSLSALVARLEPLIRSVLGERIQLHLELAPGSTSIVADPLQIEQAVMNLIVNARDAMAEGGDLAVRVELRHGVHDDSDARSQVRLSVADRGCGIPHELHSRIFEPFFTTKPVGHGTGLGLSTVYAIVRDSGAHITLDSEPGRGTTFHIDWPRAAGDHEQPRKSQPPRELERANRRTILLVEDVQSVRELLAKQLEAAGYRVRMAANGVHALELLTRESCDLVLSDLIMPKLGGLELSRELRARHPTMRRLWMTGYAPEAVLGVEEQHWSGEPLLRKPFTTPELLRAVSAELARR